MCVDKNQAEIRLCIFAPCFRTSVAIMSTVECSGILAATFEGVKTAHFNEE